MKFTRILIVFLILISALGIRHIFGFSDARLFGASLVSLINFQNQEEERLPEEIVYVEPQEPELEQEVEVLQGNADVAIVIVESTQDKIDDILEKIDILQQQLLVLNENIETDEYEDELDEALDEESVQQPVVVLANNEQVQPVISVVTATGAHTGGGASYPKIIISEVQIEGLTDSKEEFVELYNPSAQDIDLTGWYLQRKTKGGLSYATFVPNTLFTAKKITGKGYFLVAREGFLSGLADIFIDNPLTEDNSLILKNPNEEVSDKIGWGEAQDFESFPAENPMPSYSIGRNGDEQDTNVNSVDFTATNPTPKAQNFPYVPPAPVNIEPPSDTLAPEVTFNIEMIQNSISFPVNFTITDPTGAVSGSGIRAFAFRWKENGALPADEWHEDPYENIDASPSALSSSKEFTGSDEKTYYFQIKGKDVAENESDWLPETPAVTKVSLFKKVLINEIQTAGASSKDEFIRLYNPNAVDMNLAGFALKKKTSSGTESNLVSSSSFTGAILANGHFLIAPQDDDETKNYTGDIEPNLRYSGSTFSIADNNTVLFYNASDEFLDKVGFGSAEDFETAPAQNPPENKSLIRNEAHDDTDDNSVDFHVKEEDVTAPVISNGTHEGQLPSGTLQVNLGVTTDENAECKYAVMSGQTYDELAGAFLTADDLTYTATVEGLVDGSDYSYYVKCADTVGNKNTEDFVIRFSIGLPEPELPPAVQLVVINEVAWMGTVNLANDEWMELFNPGQEDINLSGWQLISADDVLLIELSGSIESQGFYLLERTSDDTVSDVLADQIYVGALSNGGEHLYIKDGLGNIIYGVDCAAGWFAGDNETKQTMQRKDSALSGNSADSWQTSQD